MRVLNNNKLNKFKYFFETSEKGFVVAEINAIPILDEFLNSFSSDVEKIDVNKCNDYHSVLAAKSTPRNVILYNFEERFSTPENISDEINLNRDIFYSYDKNIIFVLKSSSIDELMQENTSFWSCVFFHEFFCDYLPPLFNYKLINEVEVSYNYALIDYSTIYAHVFQVVNHSANDLKDINEILENPTINDVEIFFLILKTLYSYGKFRKIINHSNNFFKNVAPDDIDSATHLSYYYRILLLRAAAYYNVEDYLKSKSDYQYIVDNENSYSGIYIIALNNLNCLNYKISALELTEEPCNWSGVENNFANNFNKIYSSDTLKDEEVLSENIKYDILLNYCVCLLNNNEFQMVIEVVDEKIKYLNYSHIFRFYKENLTLNLVLAYAYISLGDFGQAYFQLKRREYGTVSFKGHDTNVYIGFLSLVCNVYQTFSIGDCSEAFYILKDFNLSSIELLDKEYASYCYFNYYYYLAILYHWNHDKQNALLNFEKAKRFTKDIYCNKYVENILNDL